MTIYRPKGLKLSQIHKVLKNFDAYQVVTNKHEKWERKVNGQTFSIAVPSKGAGKEIAMGTCKSICNQAMIPKKEFWKAAYEL